MRVDELSGEAMTVTDGPEINFWDGLGVVAWVAAIALTIADEIAYDTCSVGPLFPFAVLSGIVGAVLAVASVIRRCRHMLLDEMHKAFELGRQSAEVSQIRPKV